VTRKRVVALRITLSQDEVLGRFVSQHREFDAGAFGTAGWTSDHLFRGLHRLSKHAGISATGSSRGGLVGELDDFDAIAEFDALNAFRQLIFAFPSTPGFRRRHHQLENHELRSAQRPVTTRASRGWCDAAPSQGALNWV